MTHYKKEKADFVMNHLEPLLRDIDSRITSVSYIVTDGGNEQVAITWENKGQLEDAVIINVTYDSKAALVMDVIKTFL